VGSKTDEAKQVVASVVISIPVGGQVPTTLALAKHAKAASGTIQTALRELEGSGAVTITSHGSFGRRIQAKDLGALWTASGRGPLTGVLPLPDSREFSGLATAFTEAAERRSIPLQLLFRQGSRRRLQFLESRRVDFVVMSSIAAHAHQLPTIAITLGPHTYYRENSVVVITAAGAAVGQPTRVPADQNSKDHVSLTEREFPGAEFVDTPYMFIPDLVVNGTFEAAVWHQSASSPLLVGSGLAIHPLRHPNLATGDAQDRAAIVWRSEDAVVGGFISEFFEPSLLERIQKEVMDNVRIPQF